MNQTIYQNPFTTWAELLRGLRVRFIREAGMQDGEAKFAPTTGQLLGAIGGLIDECESARRLLDRLERDDLDAFAAFQRALSE